MNNQPTLGDLAKDTITGFCGVVIARTEWLTGCDRLTLQPRELKDGKPIDSVSFDITQLKIVKRGVTPYTPKNTGGPRAEPVKR